MPPRFDAEGWRLELAVADLLDASLKRSLGFANRGGYERLWLGQAIHSRYQEEAEARDPSYRREVPLVASFDHRGWTVTLQGRADGLRREGETLVVEEIKSVRRDGQLSAAARDLYRHQARIYGWILRALEPSEVEIGAELVLIEIGSERIDREPVELDFAEIERAVRIRVNRLLGEFERRRAAVSGRRGAGERLRFPYPELRPGQEQMLAAVDRALESGGHLLVEAPTGIGKTVGALHPALRYALQQDKRVFVLTAKTLQQEMATTVIRLLNQEDAFHGLRLRAKAKMCANDEVLCHEEYCAYARDYYGKLQTSAVVPRLLREERLLLPERVFDAAREAEVCPFEVSLELSREAQVVVCDYNYVFDPYVALTDFSSESELSDVILVVDEIHNLVDRGRGYYSPTLSARQARTAAERLGGNEPVHRRASELCRRLAATIEGWVESVMQEGVAGARAVESTLPEDDLFALRVDFDEVFVDLLEHRREASAFTADDPFVTLYFELLRFLNGLLVAQGDAFSRFVQNDRSGAALRILCADPSRFLGALINRTHSTIGLSATLSPVEFYRDLLGFDPDRLSHLSLASPFPAENRRLVIDDSVATTYRRRPDNYQPIADRLGAFADRVPGNCMALFPSYSFLDEVARRLRVGGKRLLVQSQAGNDGQRTEILEALRNPLSGDALLLAVAGGVFAEGVDYPGEMLKAVVVVGPCLPAVSLERELLRRYYEEHFERGFEYAFVVPGMTRVVQAAGRLIRSADDRGVVALMDERFLAPPYRRHLPEDWTAGGEPEALVDVPSEVAASFFSEPAVPR